MSVTRPALRIIVGDCVQAMRTLDACSVDSVVTDPPYHLTNNSGGPHGKGKDTPFARARAGATSTGFMGQAWDGGDVAFCPETWVEALRVLKPGGFLVAFGGTRTFHRLVCAIEDGGFEVRDMLAWLYGSGFPKGTDSAKIPEAWAGWNTAMKPALEPICLARKPMDGTLAENLKRWGTGALNIDGCRVDLGGEVINQTSGGRQPVPPQQRPEGLGRWPANVMHDGSDEVLAAFPKAPGQIASASANAEARKTKNVYGAMRRGRGTEASADSENAGSVGFKMRPGARRLDAGSAARYFYCAKASAADRGPDNNHPTVKPTDLMRWLCRLVTPPGGLLLDPFMGSGSTLKAAELEGLHAIGIERETDYVAIASSRIGADAPLLSDVSVEGISA